MLSNKVFQIAFLISLLTHTAIMFQNAGLNLFNQTKLEKKLEVSYVKTPKKTQESPKAVPHKRGTLVRLPSKIIAQKRTPPPYIDKQNLPRPIFSKPSFIRPDIISIKKKITLPPIDMDKINNPSYISYYQIVREKIRRAAYQNYTRTETGEVYLSFIISNDGYLKDVRLSEEKSSAQTYLREISLRSVKDASPFPNFPKELDYPELSFNVVISFEIE